MKKKLADVYLNQKFIGNVDEPAHFVEKVLSERRRGSISKNINIFFDELTKDVYLESSKGRARRPLIVVKNGESLLTKAHLKQLEKGELSWSDLVSQGIIEYLDSLEEENAFVAITEKDVTPEHTHLEISPISILGYCTTLVPYANHSPGPRIIIGSKNQKQSLGLYALNFPVRIDTDISLLHYPQKPIVKTIMHEISKYEDHPSGQNVIVAILSFEGYNMDDAIVLNKSSVDRGLQRSTYYRPMVAEQLRYTGGLIDEIGIPDKDVKGYKSEHDYRNLEEDGIVYPEAAVFEDDVLIGRTSPPRFLSGLDEYNLASGSRRESSVSMHYGESGVVDFVMLTENEEGNRLVQARVRNQMIPEIGDKFTSRFEQKGVLGLLLPQVDMPFTASGVIPDLVFSPHGIPSRMTISYLIELVGAKAGALNGRYIDGTSFESEPEKSLREELASLGFRDDGAETMYNGKTGEQFKSKIYVGNLYYLRLRLLVANRIQARAMGPVQLLTRQPTEGRAKDGGLRLGEMEKDTLVAHGASLLLKERFDSDRTVVPVCNSCGMIAIYDKHKKQAYCPVCGDATEIYNIELSYAFKLLLDEFKSMGIYPSLKLENKF